MGLKEQIEAWPEAVRTARKLYAEASAEFSEVDQALIQASDRHTELLERGGAVVAEPVAELVRNEEARQHMREADERAQAARDALNRAKAAADVQVRREADQAGKRLTETAVKAQVQVHPDVVAAEERWRDAQAQVTAARGQITYSHGAELYQPNATDTAFDKALAAASAEMAELQRRRAQLLGKLAFARAEVKHQVAVGKALDMLTRLAEAEAQAKV